MSRSQRRTRAVFDCNVFLQAAAFEEGPAAQCLRLAEAGTFDLVVSKQTMAELRRVLAYEEVLAISPNLTAERIAGFVKRVAFRSILIKPVRRGIRLPRDPDDEAYLNLALAAKASYLVTRDKDLLSLMTGHSLACKQFRRKTRPLNIINPVEFLGGMGRHWKGDVATP